MRCTGQRKVSQMRKCRHGELQPWMVKWHFPDGILKEALSLPASSQW
jgi:hypothetical protein